MNLRIASRSLLLLITFLTSQFSILNSASGYSLFSGSALELGEPVDKAGVFKFEIPEDLTFECSLLSEIIETNGKATNFKFRLPHFRYVVPLPKDLAIDVELDELLNLDFDIRSGWQEFNGDSVERRVKGEGSVSSLKVGIGKKLNSLVIELGSFFVFGSTTEEWVTDFGDANDAFDTLSLKFSGAGGMGGFGWQAEEIEINALYFSGSKFTGDKELPSRGKISFLYTPTSRVEFGVGIASWGWDSPYEPMLRFSLGSAVDIKSLTFRGGFYSGNWYYEDIEERVGFLGIGVPFKSLLKVDLSFEFGKRWNSMIEEKIYRTCITLQGGEGL